MLPSFDSNLPSCQHIITTRQINSTPNSQDGVVVITVKGDVVHVPHKCAGGVVVTRHQEVERGRWLVDFHRVCWHRDVKRLVATVVWEEVARTIDGRRCVGQDRSIGVLVVDGGERFDTMAVVKRAASCTCGAKSS